MILLKRTREISPEFVKAPRSSAKLERGVWWSSAMITKNQRSLGELDSAQQSSVELDKNQRPMAKLGALPNFAFLPDLYFVSYYASSYSRLLFFIHRHRLYFLHRIILRSSLWLGTHNATYRARGLN